MPFRVAKTNGYSVKSPTRTLGTHKTKKKAYAQLAAVERSYYGKSQARKRRRKRLKQAGKR